jgi:DNA-binding GntR family transcriptional regulator
MPGFGRQQVDPPQPCDDLLVAMSLLQHLRAVFPNRSSQSERSKKPGQVRIPGRRSWRQSKRGLTELEALPYKCITMLNANHQRPKEGDQAPFERPATIAQQVHGRIRAEIVSMRLPPGKALSEKELSLRYGLSRTPIREALIKLAEERLVEIVPQVGTFVSRISLREVYEAQLIREALERAVVRLAAERITKKDIEYLRARLAEQSRLCDGTDPHAFYVSDEAFHQRIAEAADHPRAWHVAQQQKVHLDRVRHLDLIAVDRLPDIVAQHTAVLEALARRDVEAAERSIVTHLRSVFDSVKAHMAANSALFDEPRASGTRAPGIASQR